MNEVGKAIARTELTRQGFQVDPIEVARGKTADLFVSDSQSKYLVEVKDRLESDSLTEERHAAFKRGEMHQYSDPLDYDNCVSKALREAHKQLIDTPKDTDTFQLIWFHATGVDSDHKYRRAFITFYGHAWLRAPHQLPDPEGCLYFGFNLSHEMRDVEAMILTHQNCIQICLNEFANRANEFRNTQLCERYTELGAVFDPVAMVKTGGYIACRSDISRKNEAEVFKVLQEQTGILYSRHNLERHSFEIGYDTEANRA